jgi:uncharacterized membrane protein/glutaredoxin
MEQKMSHQRWLNFIWIVVIVNLFQFAPIRAEAAIVHAVLFYSPTCPHCQKVISEDLPPLIDKYGKQLHITAVNVRLAAGQELYQAARKQFNISKDRFGVPTLIIGNQVLVGANEIPSQFPKLIESFLAQGGIDWPPIPGLKVEAAPMDDDTSSSDNTPQVEATTLSEKLAHDPIGNSLAIIVLLTMIIVVLQSLIHFKQNFKHSDNLKSDWIIAFLALMGLAVSGYMLYIEMAEVIAICGPVSDCNSVQQSEYSHLFGIPIALFGVIAYLTILLVWSIVHYSAEKIAYIGRLVLFLLTLSGTLFSIYLTSLEPFVIGASCIWCLASAIIMTTLFWRIRAVN